ncbi:unnamed protein product [Heterobilharzia americana]|nr:unnamed protein product [Heterobilharzia americana]
MTIKEKGINRKSGIYKQRRKPKHVTPVDGKQLSWSSKKQDVAYVVTPPIATRLRSANQRIKPVDTPYKLVTVQPKQKARKSVAPRSLKTNGIHLEDTDGEIPSALSQTPLVGFLSNETENEGTPDSEPVRSSRFCILM